MLLIWSGIKYNRRLTNMPKMQRKYSITSYTSIYSLDQIRKLLDQKTTLSYKEKNMIIQMFEDIDKLETRIISLVQEKNKLNEDYGHLMKIVVDLGIQLKKQQ